MSANVQMSPFVLSQFFNNSGQVLSGGKLFIYQAGSTTKATIYTDSTGNTTLSNPVIMSSAGRPTSDGSTLTEIWLPSTTTYKVVLTSSTDTDPPTSPIVTQDNLQANGFPSSLYDSNGNAAISAVAGTGTIVNKVTVTDAATGVAPVISSSGDAAAPLKVQAASSGTLTLGGTSNAVTIGGTSGGTITLGQNAASNLLVTSSGIQLAGDQSILDSSGNSYVKFSKSATAVNQITVANAASLAAPTISTTGSDSNIGLTLSTKGTGGFTFKTPSTTTMFGLIPNSASFTTSVVCTSPTAARTITLPDCNVPNFYVQFVSNISGSASTGSTTFSTANSVPNNSQGDLYFSQSITPLNANNKLIINVFINAASSSGSALCVGLYNNAGTCIGVGTALGSANFNCNIKFTVVVTAGSTSAQTFTVRVGSGSAGTTTLNGASGTGQFGGAEASGLTIMEITG